jgi:hypothetical protein
MRYGWTGVHYLKPQNLTRRGIAAICGSREHTVSNFWQIPRFIISWTPTALGGGQQINRINSVCIVSGAIKTPPSPLSAHFPCYWMFPEYYVVQGWPGFNIISKFPFWFWGCSHNGHSIFGHEVADDSEAIGSYGTIQRTQITLVWTLLSNPLAALKSACFSRPNLTCKLFKVQFLPCSEHTPSPFQKSIG